VQEPAADLTLAKRHAGSFTQWQRDAQYTLTVSNTGTLDSSGSVTVVDSLPDGLGGQTALSGAGWSCTLATVTCTRSDPLAPGSSYPPITLVVTVAGDAPTGARAVTNTATVAGGGEVNTGNDRASDPTTVVHDLRAPVITLPDPIERNATAPDGTTVSYSVTATDNVDPSPRVSCTPESGSTFPIGMTTVQCTATDEAGNSSNGSFTITVRGAAAQLQDLQATVTSLAASPGSSLADKVADIQRAVASGDQAGACEALRAFINQVDAQTGKKITAAAAARLIASARNIQAVLAC
jgi:hypothetical protein